MLLTTTPAPVWGRKMVAPSYQPGLRMRQVKSMNPMSVANTLSTNMPPVCTSASNGLPARMSRTPSTLAVLKVE